MTDDILTFAAAERAAQENITGARNHRANMEAAPGGLAGYIKGISAVPLTLSDNPQPFYGVLVKGILPDELVPLDDFVRALGEKNNDAAFQKAIGPYRYFGLDMRDSTGTSIGAIGCEVFCHKSGPATVHSSYYSLLPEVRAHGLMREVLKATAHTAVDYIAEARPEALKEGYVLNIIESNDIAKLTGGSRLLDEAMAIHPISRDELFDHRYGFREIAGIEYHQRYDPPISLALKALRFDVAEEDGKFRVTGFSSPTGVSSGLVRAHVSGFDNLLMNYDEARERIARGKPLADPVAEGLVKLPAREIILPVRTLEEGDAHRRKWRANDEALKVIYADAALPRDKTMVEIVGELVSARMSAPTRPMARDAAFRVLSL